MVICLFGESCTGKSTIAEQLKKKVDAKVFTGKDYIKLAKNEDEAKKQFIELLKHNETTSEVLIYVVSEKEHLALLPEKTIRVLLTAELDVIKERFSKRMNGKMPAPVAKMLESKHRMFNSEKHDLHIHGVDGDIDEICEKIYSLIPPGK